MSEGKERKRQLTNSLIMKMMPVTIHSSIFKFKVSSLLNLYIYTHIQISKKTQLHETLYNPNKELQIKAA